MIERPVPGAFDMKEALRYMGFAGILRRDVAEEELEGLDEAKSLLLRAEKEASSLIDPKACIGRYRLSRDGGDLSFGLVRTASAVLNGRLSGCDEVILFAATAGFGIDRLIERNKRISPAKALALQAYGAERAEAVCDALCALLSERLSKEGLGLTKRFSPGYGDFGLENQRDIFRTLKPERLIGVTLNESLLMSPSKSVTAVAGIRKLEGTSGLPASGAYAKDCGKGIYETK